MPSCADQTKEGDPVQADSAGYPVTACHSVLRYRSAPPRGRPSIQHRLDGSPSTGGTGTSSWRWRATRGMSGRGGGPGSRACI